MARHRLEIRPTLEMLAAIDAVRGDVIRTTWIEGAIMLRLNGARDEAAPMRAGDDGLRLVTSTAGPTRVRAPKAPVATEPEPEPDVDVGEEQLDLGPQGEPDPTFPRRPSPRRSGGGRLR